MNRFTSLKATLGIFGLSIVVLATIISGASGFAPKVFASTSTSTAQTINLTVNQVITLSLSTSTLNLTTLTPGIPSFATSSATVTTNASAGWSLNVNRVNTSSTITAGSITFPDATAWNGSNNATTSPGSNLSFRANLAGTSAGDFSSTFWGASDASGTAQFAGFPTSAQIYASTSTYTGSSQTVVMQVRADSPATQVATSYSGSILITAIALP